MNKKDEDIRKALQSGMQRIDDEAFTKRIVELHLKNKPVVKSEPFINFMSLVIGISFLILNLGLVYMIKQNSEWIGRIGITDQHGFILLALSIIYLIYKFLEEIITQSTLDGY